MVCTAADSPLAFSVCRFADISSNDGRKRSVKWRDTRVCVIYVRVAAWVDVEGEVEFEGEDSGRNTKDHRRETPVTRSRRSSASKA